MPWSEHAMRLTARIDTVEARDRRISPRSRSRSAATIRQRGVSERVQIMDLTIGGCRFECQWDMPVGTRIWLTLPGLEPWPSMVAWFKQGSAGLEFDKPLHSAVARRFLANSPSSPRTFGLAKR